MNSTNSNNPHPMIYLQDSDNDKIWGQLLPLQEKNHNATHMNSTIYKSISKKNQHAKKCFNIKFTKMQQGHHLGQTCLNFFSKEVSLADKENLSGEAAKASNIEILKKEIKYLQQNDIDNQKFPKSSLNLTKANSINLQNHLRNTDINLHSKIRYLNGKTIYGTFLSTSKMINLTLSRQRPNTSQNKQAKKYFSTNTKKKSARKNPIQINQCEPIIHNTAHNKYQLIAPFRKYFQSKRNRQNRSCTIKIDQVYGRKLSKLANTPQNQN